MNTTTANWNDIEPCQPMTSAATHQREAAMSRFFATVARRSQAMRQTLRTLTAPRIYRQELKAARRMAQTIDHHPTLSNACLWAMGIAFVIEIFLYA
jgi:hypothetical protein